MPRRSLLTLSLGALLFAAASVHGAVIANRGDACGNADTCADNGTCSANICVDSIEGVKNGLGNTCSANDCCGEGLSCIDEFGAMTCVDNAVVTEAMTKVTCTGVPGGTTSSSTGTDMSSSSGTDVSSSSGTDLSSSSGTDVSSSSGTDVSSSSGTDLSSSSTAIIDPSSTGATNSSSSSSSSSTGTEPSSGGGEVNTTSSSSSTGIFPSSSSTGIDNGTSSSTGSSTGSAGVGQDCDGQTCCSGSNVCYAIGKKCGPSINGLPTIACGGSSGNSTDYTGSGAACGNYEACANDETCVSNRCINPNGQSLTNGLGNTCSADDCCPNGLACYQEANRCGPSVSTLGTVTCTKTGGPSGDQQVGPNPSGVGGNDNAAGVIAAHPIVAAGLVLASMVTSAFFM